MIFSSKVDLVANPSGFERLSEASRRKAIIEVTQTYIYLCPQPWWMPNGDLQHVLLSISLFFCRFLCRHINISSSEPRHSNFASGGSTIQSKHSTRIICNCLDWYSFRTSFENVRSLENLIQLNETETRNVVHCDYISYLWLYVFLQRLFLACYMLFFIIPFEQKRDKFKSGKMDSK